MAPGCLGEKKEFNDGIALPIMRGQKYTASELDMQLVRTSESHALTAPQLLRSTR